MDGQTLYSDTGRRFAEFNISQPLLKLETKLTAINSVQIGLQNELIIIGRTSVVPSNSTFIRRDELLVILKHEVDPKYHYTEDLPDLRTNNTNGSQLLYVYSLTSPIDQDYLIEMAPGQMKISELGETVFVWDTSYEPNTGVNDTSEVKIICTYFNQSQEVFAVNMVVMAEVDSYAKLILPDLMKYVQTPKIALATRFDSVFGNAPSFSLQGPPGKFSLRTEHIDKLRVEWAGKFKSMKNVRGIGGNLVALWNETDFEVLRCTYSSGNQSLNCSDEGLLKLSLENDEIMEILLVNDCLVFAFRANQTDRPSFGHLKISIIELSGRRVKEQFYDFHPTAVKMQRNSVYVLLHAIGRHPLHRLDTLYYMQFNPLKDHNLPRNLLPNIEFPEFLCPVAISPDYKSRFVLYITCRCYDSTQTTVVSFNFTVDNIAGSTTASSVFLQSTSSILVCASNQNLFVVDIDTLELFIMPQVIVGSRFTRVKLPLVEYGVTKVLDCLCETRRRAMQVLGSTANGEKILITYRTEGFSDATKRVHSVVTVHQDSTEILKVTNMGEDRLFTITMDKESRPLEAYIVESNGPFLYLDGSNQTVAEDVQLTINCELVSRRNHSKKSITAEQKIRFFVTNESLRIFIDPTKEKIKIMNDITINLDQLVRVAGYYSSIASKLSPAYIIQDRIPLDSMLEPINGLSLTDSCGIEDMVFGYSSYKDWVAFYLLNTTTNQTLLQFMAKSAIMISCLQQPDQADNMFVALVLNYSGLNWINVISWQQPISCLHNDQISPQPTPKSASACEPQWIVSGLNLYTDGYVKASIASADNSHILLAASSFNYGFMYMVRILFLDKGQLLSSSECQASTKEIITGLKVLSINNSMVLIYTELNNMTMKFDYYKKNAKHLLIHYESHAVQLSDKLQPLMANNIYDCQAKFNAVRKLYFSCVLFDDDTIAYMFDVVPTFIKFRRSKPVVRRDIFFNVTNWLEPLPYSTPAKVKVLGEYVVLFSKAGPYSNGKDMMLASIYRLPSENYLSKKDSNILPYKILSSETVNSQRGLDLLDGNFYTTRNGSSKFYMKSGNFQRMVFNMTALSLKIFDINGIKNDSTVVFTAPDRCFGTCSFSKNRKKVTLHLGSVIDLDTSKDSDEYVKKKKYLLLAMSTGGLTLLLAFLAHLFWCTDKKQRLKINEIFNETQVENSAYYGVSMLENNLRGTFGSTS